MPPAGYSCLLSKTRRKPRATERGHALTETDRNTQDCNDTWKCRDGNGKESTTHTWLRFWHRWACGPRNAAGSKVAGEVSQAGRPTASAEQDLAGERGEPTSPRPGPAMRTQGSWPTREQMGAAAPQVSRVTPGRPHHQQNLGIKTSLYGVFTVC